MTIKSSFSNGLLLLWEIVIVMINYKQDIMSFNSVWAIFSPGLILVFFLIDSGSCFSFRGEFQKKRFNEAEDITSCNMGAKEQYPTINFCGEPIGGI